MHGAARAEHGAASVPAPRARSLARSLQGWGSSDLPSCPGRPSAADAPLPWRRTRFRSEPPPARHRTALQFQGEHGGRAELPEIQGISSAQVALGRDVQPYGHCDRGSEAGKEPAGADLFVVGIRSPVLEKLGYLLEQVSDVVQNAATISGSGACCVCAKCAACRPCSVMVTAHRNRRHCRAPGKAQECRWSDSCSSKLRRSSAVSLYTLSRLR